MKIVRLFNELLGTYGDSGNAEVLAYRATLGGKSSEIIDISYLDPIPTDGDIYLLGGAEDAAQVLACEKLAKDQTLEKMANDGKIILAICAAYQILGEKYYAQGKELKGLGLLPITTIPGEQRFVGDIKVELPNGDIVTGFENHGGKTNYLKENITPFGKVLAGFGNGDGKFDGIWQENIIATYLHGPLLARNPRIADQLLQQALGVASFQVDDPLADEYHLERLKTF
jgi:lipid II isoglutaminyl synthase (glutamine-hydrolysing)